MGKSKLQQAATAFFASFIKEDPETVLRERFDEDALFDWAAERTSSLCDRHQTDEYEWGDPDDPCELDETHAPFFRDVVLAEAREAGFVPAAVDALQGLDYAGAIRLFLNAQKEED